MSSMCIESFVVDVVVVDISSLVVAIFVVCVGLTDILAYNSMAEIVGNAL